MKFNFIDVGSSGIMPEVWKKEYINNIVTFDPLDINKEKSLTYYTGKRFHYPIAVFDIPGERDFYICRKSQVSSLLKPNLKILKSYFKKNSSRFDVIKIIKVNCRRLDDVIKEIGMDFDFLKIDAQGADLNVLKSAGSKLSCFKGLQVECNHIPFYIGDPMMKGINDFLVSKNFILEKKISYKKYIKIRKPLWNDCLYINKNITFQEKQFIKDIYTSNIFI